jgi:hypothetical protein
MLEEQQTKTFDDSGKYSEPDCGEQYAADAYRSLIGSSVRSLQNWLD